jgi:hypothetical protein
MDAESCTNTAPGAKASSSEETAGQRFFGRGFIDCRHRGHRIPDIANLVDSDNGLILISGAEHAKFALIFFGDDRINAGEAFGLTRINPPDARVRVRAAQYLGMCHPGQIDIDGVNSLASNFLCAVRSRLCPADNFVALRIVH